MKYDQIIKDLQRFLGKDEKIIKNLRFLGKYDKIIKNLQRFLGKYDKIIKNLRFLGKFYWYMFSSKI